MKTTNNTSVKHFKFQQPRNTTFKFQQPRNTTAKYAQMLDDKKTYRMWLTNTGTINLVIQLDKRTKYEREKFERNEFDVGYSGVVNAHR